MKAVGFSGKSGCGKSFRAIGVAKDNGLRLIVDDGLLICDGKVLAGKSAKKEKNPYASTLRAIFNDPSHAEDVRKAIAKSGESSILILGTSEKMVNLIADRIGVSPIEKHIHIEDVASEEEIQTANVMRSKFGKHVIPVPTFEIKRTFSGYFIDPISSIKKLAGDLFDKNQDERTIIRPKYSYFGDFEISERVLCQIAEYEASNTQGVVSVDKVVYYGTTAKNEFRVDIGVEYGKDIRAISSEIQKRIKKSVDYCAAVYIDKVDVNVVSITSQN